MLYHCCSRIPGVSGQSTGGSLGVLYHYCSGYLVSVVSQPVVAYECCITVVAGYLVSVVSQPVVALKCCITVVADTWCQWSVNRW